MTIERPGAVAGELQADLRAHVTHDREIVELAISMLNDYQRLLDRPSVVVNVKPGPNPSEVAQATMASIARGETILPTGPTPPSGAAGVSRPRPEGRITERDRFLDDASDRRGAMAAAARVLGGVTQGRVTSADEITNLTSALYAHLRQGKADA